MKTQSGHRFSEDWRRLCGAAVGCLSMFLTAGLIVFLLVPHADAQMKWNPGHYLAAFKSHLNFTNNPPTGAPTFIKGNESFKGVLLTWEWSDIEKEQGVYDFSDIFRHINEFRSWNPQPHMIIRISYKVFRENQKYIIPDYVYTVNNGTCVWDIDNKHGMRSQYAVWRPECLKYYTNMLDALSRTVNPETGLTLNQDPLFEGIKAGESALGGAPLGQDPDFDSWDVPPEEHSYVQGLLELHRHTQKAFPNSLVFIGLNWLVDDVRVQYVADWAAENGIGVSGPDMSAWASQETSGSQALYPGLTGARDYRGVIPIARENQSSRMLSSIMCNGRTISDVFQWLIEDANGPKLTHAFWTRQNLIENCGVGWSWDNSSLADNRRVKKVVANRNARANTACPTAFSSCITDATIPVAENSPGNTAPAAQNPPRYTALPAPASIVVDGDLKEYASAPSISLTNSRGTQGVYRLLYDSQYLYVATEVSDSEPKADYIQRDDRLWEDDALEMMLDTLNDKTDTMGPDDYKYFVNLLNTQTDSRDGERAWNSGMQSQVRVRAGGYDIELAIPWADMDVAPAAGMTIGLELAMNDKDNAGVREQTVWANINGSGVNDPDGWGDLVLGTESAEAKGLQVEYFDFTESLSAIPDLSGRTADVVRIEPQINQPSVKEAWTGLDAVFTDTFAARYRGKIRIPQDGTYSFYLTSDDGSRLLVDGQVVVDNDGIHGMIEQSGSADLTAGDHVIEVVFFENAHGAGIQLAWSGPGIGKEVVPSEFLLAEVVDVLPEPPLSVETSIYAVLQAPAMMAVDGNLQEFIAAPDIVLTNSRGTQGVYRLLYDSRYLYVATEVNDSELNADYTQRDERLWEDDALEMMLDTMRDGGDSLQPDDYKFFVNLINAQTDSRDGDRAWDSGMQSQVQVHAGGYWIELAIPWADMGVTPAAGMSVGFELALNDKNDAGIREQTVWSNTNGSGVNDPDGWGALVLGTASAVTPELPNNTQLTAGSTDGVETSDRQAIMGTELIAGSTGRAVAHDWQAIMWDVSFTNPVVLAGLTSFYGGDAAGLRMQNLAGTSVDVRVEEESSGDSETNHTTEDVHYLVLENGPIHDDSGTMIGEAGNVTESQADGGTWHSLSFTQSYSAPPVVLMNMVTYNGGQPAHIRIKDVTAASFRYQIEEWDYLDGGHITEDIHYVVLKPGTHSVAGHKVRAGLITHVNHDWQTVNYGTDFASAPIVISQSQSYNANQAMVTRQKNITSSSVQIRVQEEEGNDGGHAGETIGFVAVK